jgi:hypothetical protein
MHEQRLRLPAERRHLRGSEHGHQRERVVLQRVLLLLGHLHVALAAAKR